MKMALPCLLVALGCNAAPPIAGTAPQVSFRVPQGVVTVAVEVADTPSERTQGLMNRESLGEYNGMVFVFPREEEHVFWMRDTLIPLDMIFIDARLIVVGVVHEAEPLTDDPRTVGVPSRFVVEVNGGFAAEHGIATGVEVSMNGVPMNVTQ
ncbi:MAG: DUF192 domain-containing protein [Deltaproteobacteria bacterium]|nr:DUF192 domain-containing protein [Deltaproteobacteria bacterium]